MRFDVEHRFPAPPETVAALLVDAGFVTGIALPDLAPPDVVAHEPGPDARLALRYEYVGQLDPIAKRLLGRRRLTLLQEVRIDLRTGSGSLVIAAEAEPDKIRGEATIVLTPEADGTQTVRAMHGDFRVRVPLVGGTAERRILPGVLLRLDVEAAAVAAACSDRP